MEHVRAALRRSPLRSLCAVLAVLGLLGTMVLLEHSRRLAAALQAVGMKVVYAELADGTHIPATRWDVTGSLALAFLGRQLEPER